jgi:asparagine synthase (glutamine-hydrolysing)
MCTRLFGREPDVELSGGRTGLAVCTDGDAVWATDPSGRVTVVVHGDLHGPGESSAQSVAARVVERGIEVAGELDGRFALLVHEADSRQTWVVTDRANGRWLFHARVDGYHVVTTELAAQPTRRFALDPVGIGWALSAGMAVRGRTLYEGIRILEGGSTHLLTAEGVESKPYWTYSIEDRTGGRSQERLEDDLYSLLVESVRSAVADTSDPILSLSVGFDLTAVAGILVRELGYRDVESFSYARGTPVEGSDAHTASRLVGLLGLRHQLVESYQGDLVSHIRRNALLGQGLGNPCEEVDAWYRLGAEMAVRSNPVVLTGDQRFGGKDIAFRDPEGVRQIVGLRPLRLPAPLSRYVPEAALRTIAEGQEADWRAVLAATPPYSNLNDLHDHLRWTERLRHRIMPWRERFAGRFFRVRTPWLNRPIVEYVAGLPPDLRMGKKLYKRTVTRRLPDLYDFPRAGAGGYEVDLGTAIRSESSRVRRTLLTGTSRLDELIPRDAVLALMLGAGGKPSTVGEAGGALAWPVHRLSQRVRRKLGGQSVPLQPRALQLLFRRIAVIREALR